VRADLPADINRPLGYHELVAALRTVVGEAVRAPVGGAGRRSGFTAAGPLRDVALARAPAFAVGDSFEIVLDEQDFVGARLWTAHGNARFEIHMQFGAAHLTVGSPDAQ
jgi:hypothetical protein